jgi:hypothetical protein
MKKRLVTLSAAVLLTGGSVLAQETTTTTTTTTTTVSHAWTDPNEWWGSHWKCSPELSFYNANELTLDFFGSFLANQRGIEHLFETNIRKGHWGGGVGANYFFCNWIGIGGDVNMPANGGPFVDSINGSLIARMPIMNTGIAPYIFGGGGRQTDPAWQWTGHAGVGCEFRFNPYTGIFADARYTWVDKTSDLLYLRAGLRFAF